MISTYISVAVVSLVISFASTPVISRLAHKNGVVDLPGGRKIHRDPKPLMGGLSLFLAGVITAMIFYPLSLRLFSLALGCTIIVVVGVLDDIRDLRPVLKLLGQAAAALVLVLLNLESYGAILSFMDLFFIPEFVTVFLIAGWVVLIINAFNLIDGLDGLAAGTASVIAPALAVVALLQGNWWLFGIILIGLGACLGFLPYNIYPAKIFLGDTGSMMLGFLLAAFYLFVVTEPFSASLVLASAFIFAYPALDVTFAIYRRLRRGGNIFRGDRGHIHHLLLKMGLPVPAVVMILCLGGTLFAGLGVLLLCIPVHPVLSLALGGVTITGVIYLFAGLNRLARPADRITRRYV